MEPDDHDAADLFPATPLFPLPNVVLFPRAVLPLHIFEERYKEMTADALAGNRLIAMALLRPGWEKDYYGRPVIDPVVCVGQILTHEQLPDGKYNFLLQGVARAKVVGEVLDNDTPYRRADLERLPEQSVLDLHLDNERSRLSVALRGRLGGLPGARQFVQMLSSPMSTPTVADLIAFHLLDDPAVKQSLLADPDVRARVSRTVDAVEAIPTPAAEKLGNVRFPSDPSLN